MAPKGEHSLSLAAFGAVGDGKADDTAAVMAAVAAAGSGPCRVIRVPAGRFRVSRTIPVLARGLAITGTGRGRPAAEGGTRFEFAGAGPLFQMGAESRRVGTARLRLGSASLYPNDVVLTSADVGARVKVEGAGAEGAALTAGVKAVDPSGVVTLDRPALTAVTGAGLEVNYYDSGRFDGVQGFRLAHLSLAYVGPSVPLANGMGRYGPGTYGLRDFRGGDVRVSDVHVEGFEFGFWGVASDVNSFEGVNLLYNRVGAYLGPRSDQNSWSRVYSLFNDTAVEIDTARHARFTDCQFVGDGSAATYPIMVHSASGVHWAAEGSVFTRCWLEHGQGAPTVPAFLGVGLSPATLTTRGVTFRDCGIFTGAVGPGPRCDLFARVGNADAIDVESPWGNRPGSRWFEFTGPWSPSARLRGHSLQAGAWENAGTGTPAVSEGWWGHPGPLPVPHSLVRSSRPGFTG